MYVSTNVHIWFSLIVFWSREQTYSIMCCYIMPWQIIHTFICWMICHPILLRLSWLNMWDLSFISALYFAYAFICFLLVLHIKGMQFVIWLIQVDKHFIWSCDIGRHLPFLAFISSFVGRNSRMPWRKIQWTMQSTRRTLKGNALLQEEAGNLVEWWVVVRMKSMKRMKIGVVEWRVVIVAEEAVAG